MSINHFQMTTEAHTAITVYRLGASNTRSQGLVIDADNTLNVNGIKETTIVLWADTSPEKVEIQTTEAGSVRFWHAWRDGDLVQAWQGHAHIEVERDEGLRIRCRDGHGNPHVDLDVRIEFG